jgi:hypothetical protein
MADISVSISAGAQMSVSLSSSAAMSVALSDGGAIDGSPAGGAINVTLSDAAPITVTVPNTGSLLAPDTVEFVYADLNTGEIVFAHNQGTKFVSVEIFNQDGELMQMVDYVRPVDTENVAVGLISYGEFEGTWRARIRR